MSPRIKGNFSGQGRLTLEGTTLYKAPMTQDPKIYQQVQEAAVWCDLQQIEDVYSLKGSGFLDFLNSYNSQDIKSLPIPGVALGSFLTQKGKLVSPAVVVKETEEILLLLPQGYGDKVAHNLAVYLDFSEVSFTEQNQRFFHLVILGPRASLGPLENLPPPELKNSMHRIGDGASSIWAFSTDRWGIPAWEVLGAADQRDAFLQSLPSNLPQADESLLELLRIEAGLPKMGVDMGENNLLAEVGLDERATSFNKGCYLGQETTARVKSQGRVQRHLVKIQLSEAPKGTLPLSITLAGNEVGTLSSWTHSPKWNHPIGLALIKNQALASPQDLKIETESQSLSLQTLSSGGSSHS